MDDLTKQQQAELQRATATDEYLTRLRADYALKGVGFTWQRDPSGRLIGILKGRESRPMAFQSSSAALTILMGFFPSAVILQGGILEDHLSWVAIVWLDATENDARRAEDRHPELEPKTADPVHDPNPDTRRCPHDGKVCQGVPSRLYLGTPRLCRAHEPCERETQGLSLRRPYRGYPLPGHAFPARKKES